MAATDDDKAKLEQLADDVRKAKKDAGLSPEPAVENSGAGMQTGVELVGSVLLCTLAGVMLDRWLHTAPLFMLVLLALGFAAGLWRAYRATMN